MASETPEQQLSASQTSGAGDHSDETLSPLEQEVLDEYARLLGNLNNMSSLLLDLSNSPSAAILDGLRGLERKTSLVFTLLKASVYSIVLNQQVAVEEGAREREDDGASVGSMEG